MSDDRLLELIGEVIGLTEMHEFRAGLLAAVRAAVPADWISLNDLGPEPADVAVLIEPPFPPESHELYARHAMDNPLVARHLRTGDGRAYRFSDVCTPDELHATALYREFYGPLGVEHQIAFTLPSGPDRVVALALSRRDEDFSDSERDLLNAARPFLIQAYRNAIERARLVAQLEARSHSPRLPLDDPGLAALLVDRNLTARQAEILSWAATGRSDQAIAHAVGLSARTVQKHLQGCFTKLGVHSRDAAVRLAWERVGAATPEIRR